jgi:hypothetical protein
MARPVDGSAIVLDPTSTVVWGLLSEWRAESELDQLLGEWFPTVDGAERSRVLSEVLEMLAAEELLERAQP